VGSTSVAGGGESKPPSGKGWVRGPAVGSSMLRSASSAPSDVSDLDQQVRRVAGSMSLAPGPHCGPPLHRCLGLLPLSEGPSSSAVALWQSLACGCSHSAPSAVCGLQVTEEQLAELFLECGQVRAQHTPGMPGEGSGAHTTPEGTHSPRGHTQPQRAHTTPEGTHAHTTAAGKGGNNSARGPEARRSMPWSVHQGFPLRLCPAVPWQVVDCRICGPTQCCALRLWSSRSRVSTITPRLAYSRSLDKGICVKCELLPPKDAASGMPCTLPGLTPARLGPCAHVVGVQRRPSALCTWRESRWAPTLRVLPSKTPIYPVNPRYLPKVRPMPPLLPALLPGHCSLKLCTALPLCPHSVPRMLLASPGRAMRSGSCARALCTAPISTAR